MAGMIVVMAITSLVAAGNPMRPGARRMIPMSAVPTPSIFVPTPATANPDETRAGSDSDSDIFLERRRRPTNFDFSLPARPRDARFAAGDQKAAGGEHSGQLHDFRFVHISLFAVTSRGRRVESTIHPLNQVKAHSAVS